ncbi:chemotaxis protein CheC [Candidatus Gracilibacteria bacterium]|nr:chemotaxis protein CheC [Candidatus Gracilibacteria bacterium]
MNLEEAKNMQMDALAEMANIGAGNAATALSHMLNKKIEIDVPVPFIGELVSMERQFVESKDAVVAVFLKVQGDINGAMLNLFTPESALSFVNLLSKKEKKEISTLNEEDKSTLLEVSNILLGSSLTAISKFLKLNTTHSIPDISTDMLGAVMDTVFLEMGAESDHVIAFKINLKIEGEKIGGDLFFLFDPKSTDKILEKIKIKLNVQE